VKVCNQSRSNYTDVPFPHNFLPFNDSELFMLFNYGLDDFEYRTGLMYDSMAGAKFPIFLTKGFILFLILFSVTNKIEFGKDNGK
jgi:hypothetical protein